MNLRSRSQCSGRRSARSVFSTSSEISWAVRPIRLLAITGFTVCHVSITTNWSCWVESHLNFFPFWLRWVLFERALCFRLSGKRRCEKKQHPACVLCLTVDQWRWFWFFAFLWSLYLEEIFEFMEIYCFNDGIIIHFLISGQENCNRDFFSYWTGEK